MQNKTRDPRCSESEERTRLITITIFSSWIAPISVLKNDNSNKYKWHLFITSYSTKIWQITCAAFLYFIFPKGIRFDETLVDNVLYVIICLGMLNCVSTIFLHFLGNYFNLYRASTVCKLFCVSPIVHKALIFEYLETPSYFPKDNEDDSFPTFFKFFLKEKKHLSRPGKYFEKADVFIFSISL